MENEKKDKHQYIFLIIIMITVIVILSVTLFSIIILNEKSINEHDERITELNEKITELDARDYKIVDMVVRDLSEKYDLIMFNEEDCVHGTNYEGTNYIICERSASTFVQAHEE